MSIQKSNEDFKKFGQSLAPPKHSDDSSSLHEKLDEADLELIEPVLPAQLKTAIKQMVESDDLLDQSLEDFVMEAQSQALRVDDWSTRPAPAPPPPAPKLPAAPLVEPVAVAQAIIPPVVAPPVVAPPVVAPPVAVVAPAEPVVLVKPAPVEIKPVVSATPAARIETKLGIQAEVKSAARPETKAVEPAEPKLAVRAETKAAFQAEVKATVQAESKSVAKAEAKSAAQAKLAAQAQAEAQLEAEALLALEAEAKAALEKITSPQQKSEQHEVTSQIGPVEQTDRLSLRAHIPEMTAPNVKVVEEAFFKAGESSSTQAADDEAVPDEEKTVPSFAMPRPAEVERKRLDEAPTEPEQKETTNKDKLREIKPNGTSERSGSYRQPKKGGDPLAGALSALSIKQPNGDQTARVLSVPVIKRPDVTEGDIELAGIIKQEMKRTPIVPAPPPNQAVVVKANPILISVLSGLLGASVVAILVLVYLSSRQPVAQQPIVLTAAPQPAVTTPKVEALPPPPTPKVVVAIDASNREAGVTDAAAAKVDAQAKA